MGLRRAQGSRSKQQDSDKRRHTLVVRPGVRESGMRLPSETARDCALSVAASIRLTLMGSCRTGGPFSSQRCYTSHKRGARVGNSTKVRYSRAG